MRLIDADVFKTEYENLITWVSYRTEKARLREFVDDIQSQPTVNAIPVEWIRQWYKSREYLTEGKTAICRMIWDWDKENE